MILALAPLITGIIARVEAIIQQRYGPRLVAVSIAYTPAHAETASDRRQTVDAAEQYLRQTFADVADCAQRAGVEVATRSSRARRPPGR